MIRDKYPDKDLLQENHSRLCCPSHILRWPCRARARIHNPHCCRRCNPRKPDSNRLSLVWQQIHAYFLPEEILEPPEESRLNLYSRRRKRCPHCRQRCPKVRHHHFPPDKWSIRERDR